MKNLKTFRKPNGDIIDLPIYIDDYVDDDWQIKDGLNLFNKSGSYGVNEYEDINIGATSKAEHNHSRWWKYQKWRGRSKKFAVGLR